MKKAMVLCGGIPQISLIRKLQERKIETILLDMNENVAGRRWADKFYPVSVLDVDAVRKVAIEEKVDYIFSVCADQVLQVAAQLSEELGLPFYIDSATAQKVSDKSLMKKIFTENDIPTSQYVVAKSISEDTVNGMRYPLIVKPVDSYSSRGVRRVENYRELKEAFEGAVSISRTKQVIIEEFVSGVELSVDVYVENGKAHVLCVSSLDKIPGVDRFVINRCFFPAQISEKETALVEETAQKIADAFGLKNSPMLIQMITTGESVSVLEFCARTGGGNKFHLIKKATGFDVIRAVMELVLGEKPHVEEKKNETQFILDEFLYCRPGVLDHLEGFEELLQKNVVSGYYWLKNSGTALKEPSCSGDRVAYYTIQADNLATLKEKYALANRMVKAIGTDGEDLIRHDLVNAFS